MKSLQCRLCSNDNDILEVQGPDHRSYHHCNNCYLIFTNTENLLPVEEERYRYLLHDNRIENKGYVEFLYRIISPALQYLKPGMSGLDFGCGPSPVLACLLSREGYKCSYYDPIFFNKSEEFDKYDFIFATECFEHFFFPKKELNLLRKLLNKDGLLAIMTEVWKNINQFKDWYYARETTHVSFYHLKTLQFIAKELQTNIIYTDDKRIFLLK